VQPSNRLPELRQNLLQSMPHRRSLTLLQRLWRNLLQSLLQSQSSDHISQLQKREREAKDKQEAQKALVTTAKDELLRFHTDAASNRAAAQQADSKKAAKSYAQAAEARKKNASKAEQELHNKKAQILLKTLRQMAEARTAGVLTCVSPADGQLNSTISANWIALLISLSWVWASGKAGNASQSKKQKVNGTGHGEAAKQNVPCMHALNLFDPADNAWSVACSCSEIIQPHWSLML